MNEVAKERCTGQDYRALFASSSRQLNWLCYTLTANQQLSEQVLAAALEQSLKGAGQVFREWMVSWARRLIVRVCIATVKPTAAVMTTCRSAQHDNEFDLSEFGIRDLLLDESDDILQQSLLQLDDVSRFVFALRAIEGYSRHETALLLNLDDRTCDWFYTQSARFLQSELLDRNTVTMATPNTNCVHVAV